GDRVQQSAFGGLAKLQWKVDWAARWVALGVDYEMSGKDLIDSVTQSSKIARVLGGRPPEGFNYEMFLDEKGEKISQSKGNGLTIDQWLTDGPDESLAFYIYREPKKAKSPHLRLIPRAIDRLIGYALAYARDFVVRTLVRRAPAGVEIAALERLDADLAALPDTAGAEDIQNIVYEIGKTGGFAELRDWFRALYETLLGS